MMRARTLLLLALSCGCLDEAPDEAEEINLGVCWGQASEAKDPVEGCEVIVEGQVSLTGGVPYQGRVAWVKAEGLAGFWPTATSGLRCLVHREADPICAEAAVEIELDAHGGFRFMVPLEETEHPGCASEPVAILAQAGEGEAWIKVDLTLEAQNVTLPTFELSTARLVPDDGERVVFLAYGTSNMDQVPYVSCAGSANITSVFEADEGLVWRAEGQSVDRRVLEDFTGRAFLESGFRNEGKGPIARYTQGSSSRPFRGEGAPPSRGAGCTLRGASSFAVCPLTDGDLTEIAFDGGDAVVDLGARRDISLIVLRGAFFEVFVESSLDGLDWTLLRGSISGARALIKAPLSARYIRVRQTDDPSHLAHIRSLAEISIW